MVRSCMIRDDVIKDVITKFTNNITDNLLVLIDYIN